MQRAFVVILVAALIAAAVYFLRPSDGPGLAPTDRPAVTAPAVDLGALHAAGPKSDPTATASGPSSASRAVVGARAVQMRIRGRFEGDPRLPLANATVRVVDRQMRGGTSAARGPFGDSYAGLVPLDPTAAERARAELLADGTFDLEVRAVGDASALTLQLEHDHYFLPSLPTIAIGDGRAEHDLGSLRLALGALVIGRLVGFEAPAQTEVRLVAEIDMMAPARDPQLFAAQIASSQREPTRALADGHFRLRAVAPCPAANVRAEHGDQVGSTSRFGLAAGETREVTVHAQRAATVTVLVRDEAGAPLPGAAVAITSTAGALTGRAAGRRRGDTGSDGRAVLRGVAPGEVRVEVSKARLATQRATKTLVADEQSFEFTLSLGAAAQGRVENQQGEAVAGARIAWQPSVSIPMFGDMSSMLGADALASDIGKAGCRSDAEGRFTLTGLPDEGAVLLVVAHDDYAPATQSDVKAGRKDVRVVLQRRAQVVGRVLDGQDRQPLGAFGLEVVSAGFMGMEMPVRSEQLRDVVDGRFTLDLSPARVTLRITAPGFGVSDHKVQPTAGTKLDLGDVVMQPAASIAGRVVDEQGVAVASARVRIRRGGVMDHEIFAQMRGNTTATCTTNAAGEFMLRDVTPGKVRLLAVHGDFAAGESTRIEVAPGQAQRDVTLTLDHGGSIAGRLLLAPGARLGDWDVYAGDSRGGSVHGAKLASDGSFHIENLAPGAYNVQAMNSAGFSSAMTEGGMGKSGGSAEGPDVPALMKSIAKHLVQTQCSVKNGQVTSVELDASALAAAGATLQCEVFVGEGRLPDGFLEVRSAGQGGRIVGIENGKAEVSGLQPGTVSLQVRTGMGFSAVGEPQTTTIERVDQEKQFTLRLPGAMLAGRVVDADSGEPIRGATVRARRADAVVNAASEFGFALTDAAGEFRFRGLQPGTYSVVADELLSSDPERSSGRIEGLALGASEQRENLVLRARRGANVAITVRDGAGAPVPHAMVLLVDADGQPAATLPIAITDADGRADLAGLPDGPARAVVRVSHLAPGVSELSRTASGRELRLNVTLSEGTPVTLHLENARGEPLVGCRVAIKLGSAADGPWLSEQILGISGASADIDLGVMPVGPLRVRVEHSTLPRFEVERTVPAGRRATLTVAPR